MICSEGIQPGETEKNLEQIIKVAQNKKIKIILAGMVAPDTHGEKYKKEFDAIYPKLSKNCIWGCLGRWSKNGPKIYKKLSSLARGGRRDHLNTILNTI